MKKITWLYGCRVTVTDWIGKDENGETPIYLSVEYFKPGSSINCPTWGTSLIIPRSNENIVENYLNSIVYNIVNPKTAERDGKKQ